MNFRHRRTGIVNDRPFQVEESGDFFMTKEAKTIKTSAGSYDVSLYDPESGPHLTGNGKWDALGDDGREAIESTKSSMRSEGWDPLWFGPECLLDDVAKPTFPMIHTVRDKERANAKTQGRDDV